MNIVLLKKIKEQKSKKFLKSIKNDRTFQNLCGRGKGATKVHSSKCLWLKSQKDLKQPNDEPRGFQETKPTQIQMK